MGFFIGIFFSGLSGQYLGWCWYFWFGTFLVLVTILAALLTIPRDIEDQKRFAVKMDWPGAILIVLGLILVVFAITASSHTPGRWKSPSSIVTLTAGLMILIAAVYVEGCVAEMPLLPPEFFKTLRLKALVLALLPTMGA